MPKKHTILIVDDDKDYRASTRALLEGEGYTVIEAGSGREGRELAASAHPDLIVLDIMMESPVEGYTVVQALKFQNHSEGVREIPILMVSSVRDDPATLFPMAREMPAITPDAYLTKPIDIAKFLGSVQAMLEQ